MCRRRQPAVPVAASEQQSQQLQQQQQWRPQWRQQANSTTSRDCRRLTSIHCEARKQG